MREINNKLIRRFNSCYDPNIYIKDENETLSVTEWVYKYRTIVPMDDIFWLLCRSYFLSPQSLRLFSVWCARYVLDSKNDAMNILAVDTAEKYALGLIPREELMKTHNDLMKKIDSYRHCDEALSPTIKEMLHIQISAETCSYDNTDAAIDTSISSLVAYFFDLGGFTDSFVIANRGKYLFKNKQLDKLIEFIEKDNK